MGGSRKEARKFSFRDEKGEMVYIPYENPMPG